MKKYYLSTVAVIFLIALGIWVEFPKNSFATSSSSWVAGRIIDDSLFSNPSDMSVEQIQNFLNQLVPNCDTNGTKPASEYGRPDLTHAQYAAQKGWAAPPYVCLKDYYEVPKYSPGGYIPANNFSGSIPNGAVSAAQIIYDAAAQNNINPKVILIKIATESAGPLTSDTWPMQNQYTYAMGSHCPDSGPGGAPNCDLNYAGFSMQVSSGVGLLRWYIDNMQQKWWTYAKPYQTNSVLWSLSGSGCGSGDVYIQTKATAALYTYTPYQPNSAAINNMYGTGDRCSAYGNRNFWRTWSDWFGTPNYTPPSCNSSLQKVRCIWELSGYTDSNFLTIDANERDTAVYNLRYAYDGTGYHGFTSQESGSVPVFRIRMANEHFYTTSQQERDSLLRDPKNSYEGVAFYTYPSSSTTNASYPIYRLSNSGNHVFTSSIDERDRLANIGYSYEGIAFNAPSAYANEANPAPNNLNIYRLSSSGKHMYTVNLSERDSLIKSGWKYEGVLAQSSASQSATPVYRLSRAGTHIFTSQYREFVSLSSAGWIYEGIAWYNPDSMTQVYRFYSNSTGHFLTSNLSEALSVSNRGYTYEGQAFPVLSTSNISVHRLKDASMNYFYTSNLDEAILISNNPWQYEGVGWTISSPDATLPVYRLGNKKRHFYTISENEKNQLVSSGWVYEGIGWSVSNSTISQPVYRLMNNQRHFYTTSIGEKSLLQNSGWVYEGIGWFN